MTESLMKPNIPLLRRVLTQIDAHPETHDQGLFANVGACGTTYCFAGWAVVLSGYTYDANARIFVDSAGDMVDVDRTAQSVLGITETTAWGLGNSDDELSLFSPRATRADIQDITEKLAAEAGEEL